MKLTSSALGFLRDRRPALPGWVAANGLAPQLMRGRSAAEAKKL